MRIQQTFLAVGVVVAAIALTSCSSSSSTAVAAPASTSTSTATAASGGAASGGAASGGVASAPGASPAAAAAAGPIATTDPSAVNVCSMLPVAEASELSGMAFTKATAQVTLDPDQVSCGYNGKDTTMVVTVDLPGSQETYASLSEVVNSSDHPVAVSGVGDKAVAGGTELVVQAGTDVVDVYGDGADYEDGASAPAALVAKAIIAKLHQ